MSVIVHLCSDMYIVSEINLILVRKVEVQKPEDSSSVVETDS